ncbi:MULTISPECIES: BatD family protein [Chitinophagaceae]
MNRWHIGKKILLALFTLLVTVNVFAQLGFKLDVSSRSIGKDEVLQVSYTVQNAAELNRGVSVVGFPGWKVVSGPQTSQETSIINGVQSSSIGYIYLLMPQKTGTLSIPGASVVADGKTLTCAGTTIQVSNQSSGRNNIPSGSTSGGGFGGLQALLDQLSGGEEQPESSNVLHKGETAEQKVKDNMFVRATPSKHTVYVGEPFVVTYQLYSALGGQSKVTAQPSFQGVSVVDLTKESQPEMVTVNNKRYRAFLIRKVQLTALQPGKIALGTVETSNDIPFTSYDDPYNPQTYTQLIKNPEVTVDAKPLPEAGKPANFSGAIGNFQIRAIPQNTTLPAGENNILHIEITGEGNILPATMPQVEWPAGVEHYDPKDSQNVDKRTFPVRVSKVFDVPFIGDKQGKVAFKPITFSYFDTDAGVYKTIQSDPFTVQFTAPLPKKENADNSFGTGITTIAKVLGGLVLAILLVLLIIKAMKKSKQQPQSDKQDILDQKKDEAAPWNLEKKEKEIRTEAVANTTIMPPPNTENTIQQEEERSVKNFNIELQRILLCTNKSEMYEMGSNMVQELLAAYLNVPVQSKKQLLDVLKQSSTSETEKENILGTVQSLQDQINRGLYSPLFSEADKLNLIDGLNKLRKWVKL